MKTLNNHVILYDEECPMCKIYTKAFVQSGMLDQTGRTCYQHMPDDFQSMVDKQRAVNEIALVNRATGEVRYGIHSLFSIIGHALPVFSPLFRFRPFVWCMEKLYSFISYNRRVIIQPVTGSAYLQPSFRLRYRLAYILFTWLAVSCILSSYAHLLTGVIPAGPAYREYLVCGGQIVFQGLIAGLLYPDKQWDYLGNMMTISLAGALALAPALWLAKLSGFSSFTYAAYFLAVAAGMFLEHIRRTKRLQTGWKLTFTWVIYRVFVLLAIIFCG